MKTALLFPGQGTEMAPAIAAWSAGSDAVRLRLETAAGLLGTRLENLLERGGARLRSTAVGQPMLTALTLAIYEELRASGERPVCVAGHSLGEVAAWAACGSISAEHAVELCVRRGQVMAEAAASRPGGMLALLDANSGIVEEALAVGRAHGVVDLAAHNAPGEWVLAGEFAGLRAVAERFPSRRLEVDGAWHSRLLLDAELEFRAALAAEDATPPRLPFYCNATGESVRDPGRFIDVLGGQLTRPVLWVDCVLAIQEAGVDRFVVCGPGKALRGMVRKILGSAVEIRVVEQIEDLQLSKE
jgi:[acyl-carrier-protein] S-malonyltransferase